MPKTIFLIEDDRALVETLATFLRGKGYIVEIAYNGEEALKMLPVVRPDLILLDLILPEMNGIDFLKKSQANNEFANVSVIVLTNLQGDEESFSKLGLKVEDYLVKANTSMEELSNRIRQVLFEKAGVKIHTYIVKNTVSLDDIYSHICKALKES